MQIMACRLFGTKSLSEPMIADCQLDPCKQISMNIFIKIQFLFMKIVFKCRLQMTAILYRHQCVLNHSRCAPNPMFAHYIIFVKSMANTTP